MGNNQSLTSTQQLYQFVQNYQDQRFGNCKIYKNKFHLNEFVAQYTFDVPHDQAHTIVKNIKTFQHYLLLQNEPLPFLKIVHLSFNHQNIGVADQLTKTCRIPQIMIWVEFLRHNLKQFLEWRTSQNRPLCLDEIKMAIYKAIKAYQLSKSTFQFNKENQSFGISLNLQDVSITIDGEVKFHPFLGKGFQTKSFSLLNNKEDNALKKRILQKRSYNNLQQNLSNKIINLNARKDLNFQSPEKSQDTEFLYQLKKFVNKLVLQCNFKQQNPQDSYSFEAKDIKLFLDMINRASLLKEVFQIIGKPSMQKFMVDFSKLKHQESQSRFSKILSELQQKSQRTDYSAFISPLKQKTSRNMPNMGYFHITPSQYQYY